MVERLIGLLQTESVTKVPSPLGDLGDLGDLDDLGDPQRESRVNLESNSAAHRTLGRNQPVEVFVVVGRTGNWTVASRCQPATINDCATFQPHHAMWFATITGRERRVLPAPLSSRLLHDRPIIERFSPADTLFSTTYALRWFWPIDPPSDLNASTPCTTAAP